MARMSGFAVILAVLAATAAPALAARTLQQVPSYNQFPGCTFFQDLSTLNDPEFTTLKSVLQQTGLLATINSYSTAIATPGAPQTSLTVFAPTNAAFNNLAAETNLTADQLGAEPYVQSVLLYHVVPQPYSSLSAFGSSSGIVLPTLNGGNLSVLVENGTYFVSGYASDAQITVPASGPAVACNVLLYPIDEVLVPEEPFNAVLSMGMLTNFLTQQLQLTPPGEDHTPLNEIFTAAGAQQLPAVSSAFMTAMQNGDTPVVAALFARLVAVPGGTPTAAAIANQIYLMSNSCTMVTPLTSASNLGSNSTSFNSYAQQYYATGAGTCAGAQLPASAGK